MVGGTERGTYTLDNGCNRATESDNSTAKPNSGCSELCNRAAYATAKKLPEAFLGELRLDDTQYQGAKALRIPYLKRDGSEGAIRYRLALEKGGDADHRFRWKSGSKPFLYGLWRIQDEPIILVEGESDCHTLWYHDFNAVGVPGASQWKDARDASELAGCEQVFAVIEPDEGGETLFKSLAKSSIRSKVRIVHLDSDVSDLHVGDPASFKHQFQEKLDKAIPIQDELDRQICEESRKALDQCQELAREPDILKRLVTDIRQAGLIGEERNAKIVFLAYMSRLLEEIVSLVVKGPSSGGKSYLIKCVSKFFPPSAYHELSGMSERALAYSEEPLSHRMLVIYEAAGLNSEFGTYLLRSLLSEQKIRYEVTEKVDGQMKVRLIERDGPTGLILTTTKVALHPENETRMLTLTVTDTREQTKAIFKALASDDQREIDYTQWHALQTWLVGAEHRVVLPFGKALAEMMEPSAVRLRRDFGSILELIRAHAVLHQASRGRDAHGWIVGSLDDYAAVRELIAPLINEGVDASVPETVREAVNVIAELEETVNQVGYKDVADALNLDKSAAYRRCRGAIKRGYVVNEQTKRGQPAILKIGDPMPDDLELLPSVERLHGCMQPEGGKQPCPPEPSSDCESHRIAGKKENDGRVEVTL